MKIHPKSVEQLRSQVALYGDAQSETEYTGRNRTLLARLGEVGVDSREAPHPITYPRPSAKKEIVGDEMVTVEAAGTPMPLFVNSEYTDFFKAPRNREISRNLATMLHAYPQVAAAIERLNIPFNDYEQAGQHLNIVGRGSNKAAFAFTAQVDGAQKDLIALATHAPSNESSQAKMQERAISLALVKGRAGFEQGVAWSNEPPVVVVEQALGKSFDNITSEERAAIPAEHWDTLVTNIDAVAELGVSIDTMDENFFYDPEAGFTVIDIRRCIPGHEEDAYQHNLSYIEGLRNESIAA
jgi:hypothetical protein